MIKLLVFLFIFVSIYAHETIYNLPDNHSRLQHELGRSFKAASQILILTPSLHHPKLSKKFLSTIKKGGVVKIIVQDTQGDPLSLIQYKNVELYLSTVKPDQTVILVDDSLVCTGDTPLDEELYSSEHSVVRCSDNESRIRSIRSALYPLMQRAKPYLE